MPESSGSTTTFVASVTLTGLGDVLCLSPVVGAERAIEVHALYDPALLIASDVTLVTWLARLVRGG